MRLVHPIRFTLIMVVFVSTIVALIYAATNNTTACTVYVAPVPSTTIEVVEKHVPEYVPTTPPVVQAAPVIEHTDTKVSRGSVVRDIDSDDLYLLAKLIHCEAGVDTMAGKLAVGTVVMNRMKNSNQKMFGGPTLEGVVLHKLPGAKVHQFSCVDDKELWSEEPEKDDYEAAKKVLNGYRVFRSSFVYYYNPKISDGIDGITCDYKVGMHVFGEE